MYFRLYRWLMGMCLLIALNGCVMSTMRQTNELAGNLLQNGDVKENQVNGLYYVEAPKPENAEVIIIFVHGTPGSWQYFAHQLADDRLREKAHLFAIDRPYWGQSKAFSEDALTSFSVQSQAIASLLEQIRANYPHNKVMLVGHSYGASLVPQIVLDFPELVDYGVVLAGNLSTNYPITRWYNGVASWWLSKKILPNSLVDSNVEMLAFKDNLRVLEPRWTELQVPLMIFQGMEDPLVDPRHVTFAENLPLNAPVEIVKKEDWGHFFPLVHADELNQVIINIAEKLVAINTASG